MLGGLPRVVEECVRREVLGFDSAKPVEEAWTPPSSWYCSSAMAALEDRCVFGARGWQAAGHVSLARNPNDFFTADHGGLRLLVCRDELGSLRAFHNVCRHHAAPVAVGSGCAASFTCGYHGWTYGLNGKLLKATRLSGIKQFRAQDHGLVPMQAAAWGPFVLVNPATEVLPEDDHDNDAVGCEWLGAEASKTLKLSGIQDPLEHVARREYIIDCNWKVFCDNYLDGGYHVPYAHPALAAGLDLASYKTEIYEKVSVQRCSGLEDDGTNPERLGALATYAFVYPNLMINRYGPWMDTNLVTPLAPNKCRVVFDYFLEPELSRDTEFIRRSLEESDKVQQEDIILCEEVQKGLQSVAYDAGRYVPRVEAAMHHFHCMLHKAYTSNLSSDPRID